MFKLSNEEYNELKGKYDHEYLRDVLSNYKVVFMKYGKLMIGKVFEVHPTKLIVSTFADGIIVVNSLDCVPYSNTVSVNGFWREYLIYDSFFE